jgi:transcriptional regulator with XRE-family HTH domain
MRTENKVTVKNSTLRNVTIKNGSATKNESVKNERQIIRELISNNRERKGLTKYRLALLAGIAESQVNAVEKGVCSVSVENLVKIATALGCRLEFVDIDPDTSIEVNSKKHELFKTVFEDPATKNVIHFSA